MQKPTPVKHAEWALWVSLTISLILVIFERQQGLIDSDYFFASLVVYALCAILPYKIGQGRNWARYTFVVLSALSCATVLAGETADTPRPEVILAYIYIPVDITIGILLFRPESSAWFKRTVPTTII